MISLYLLFSLHLWGLLHWELLFLPVSIAWFVIFVIFVLFVEPPSLGPCSPSRTFILATVACFIWHFHYICYFRCVCYICGVPFPYLPSRIVILAARLLHVIFANIIFVSTKTGKGVARGVLGCPWPPLLQTFLNQTTYNIVRWQKCHDDILSIVTIWYPHFDTVWPPLWKILATPLLNRCLGIVVSFPSKCISGHISP